MPFAGSALVFLVIGCLLILVALLGAAIGGDRLRTPNATRVRVLIALVGVVLAASPYLYRLGHVAADSAPAAAAAAPPATPPQSDNPIEVATAAIEKCPLGSPPDIPDAATATLQQMEAARGAFQAYDAATNAHSKCVDDAIDQVLKQFPQASDEVQASLKVLGLEAHNTAISQEQRVADELNAQVRAYKAKHPKG
jgi:hypothetical protein